MIATKYSRWELIKWIDLPDDLINLVNLCVKFEKSYNTLLDRLPDIDPYILQNTYNLAFEILSNYILVLRKNLKDPKSSKRVEDDVKKTLSVFFDKDGKFRVPYHEITMANRDQTLSIVIPSLFSQFTQFIQSKVYDSLIQVINLHKKNILMDFSSTSAMMSGIYPDIQAKKSSSSSGVLKDSKTGELIKLESQEE